MKRHSENGVIVEGAGQLPGEICQVLFPGAGDPIVGFITRGYGVSVHRADCPQCPPQQQGPEGGCPLGQKSPGAGDTRESYQTQLEIVSKDRDGLVLDISTMLSSAKVRVAVLLLPGHARRLRYHLPGPGSHRCGAAGPFDEKTQGRFPGSWMSSAPRAENLLQGGAPPPPAVFSRSAGSAVPRRECRPAGGEGGILQRPSLCDPFLTSIAYLLTPNS